MNKIVQFSLVISLLSYTGVQAYPSKKALIAAGVTAAIAAGAALYKPVKNAIIAYKEKLFINKIADYIVIALTTKMSINRRPEKERAEKLKKKAWLIQLRMRILSKLNDIVSKKANNGAPLSNEHIAILNERLKDANSAFALIDLFRQNNPYESEFKEPSFIDTQIQNAIIASIILTSKPQSECSVDELAQREYINTRKEKIVSAVRGKIQTIWANRFLFTMALLFNPSILLPNF